MKRSLPPVFLLAREALEPLLESKGFSLYSESYFPGSFGDADAEYQRRGLTVRLMWEGRDKWVWLQVARRDSNRWPAANEWKDLEAALGAPPTAVGALEPGALADRRVAELLSNARDFFESGA